MLVKPVPLSRRRACLGSRLRPLRGIERRNNSAFLASEAFRADCRLYRGLLPFSALEARPVANLEAYGEATEQKALYVLNYAAMKSLWRPGLRAEPGLKHRESLMILMNATTCTIRVA